MSFRRNKYDAIDTIARAGALILKYGDDALKTAKSERSDDFDLHQAIQTRAAVVPMTTANTSSLVATAVADIGAVIGPMSGFSQVTARALGVTRAGSVGVSVPYALAAADTMNFIAQGSPISVKQWTFSSVSVAARKIAGIIALTRELAEHSEADKIFKQLMIENTGKSIDKLFFDTAADDGTRPAGLRNGTAALTSAGSTAMLADLTTLAAAVAPKASTMDDIVFVASVDIAIKIALALPLLKIPVISTAGLAAGTILACVPSALAVEAGPEIQFSVGEHAALHMEDTSPLPISTVATPNTIAAPVRSMWSTDAKAIRLIFEVDYKWRTAGAIAWMTSIAW